MTRAMSAIFVLHPATHSLFFINSRCTQGRQFGDDHTVAMPFNARAQVVHRSMHRTLESCDIHVRDFVSPPNGPKENAVLLSASKFLESVVVVGAL